MLIVRRASTFASTDEFDASEKLLSAFAVANQAELDDVKKLRTFTYVDNQVARLVKALEVGDALPGIDADGPVQDEQELDLT